MGNSQDKNFVAKITVEGTDIEEYYSFEEPLEEDEIKQIWLDDVRDNKSIGLRLAKQFAPNVEVERLWITRSGRQEQEKRTGQKRLGKEERGDDEETST